MSVLDRIRTGAVRVRDVLRAHPNYAIAGLGVITVSTAVAFVERKRALAIGEQVVAKIRSVLGTPYIWGSRDPAKGLDCSGTVVWALRELGLEPKGWNATAAEMAKAASAVIVPQVGDLAFYGSIFSGVNHVMVYVGDGKVIGASGGGPGTNTVAEARAKGAEVKVLPVNYRSDFRGYGRLPVQAAAGAAVGGLNMMGMV